MKHKKEENLFSKELVAASAKPIVLTILSRKESYGYEIIKKVRELSGGKMEWTDGMLYPILHRLEEQGLIEAEWLKSDEGRKRKYYRLKDEGTKVLSEEKRQWEFANNTLNKLWKDDLCLT